MPCFSLVQIAALETEVYARTYIPDCLQQTKQVRMSRRPQARATGRTCDADGAEAPPVRYDRELEELYCALWQRDSVLQGDPVAMEGTERK